jgi:hypothetical protein
MSCYKQSIQQARISILFQSIDQSTGFNISSSITYVHHATTCLITVITCLVPAITSLNPAITCFSPANTCINPTTKYLYGTGFQFHSGLKCFNTATTDFNPDVTSINPTSAYLSSAITTSNSVVTCFFLLSHIPEQQSIQFYFFCVRLLLFCV